MKPVASSMRVAVLILAAMLVSLLSSDLSRASAVSSDSSLEPQAGITINGVGVAGSESAAIPKAVHDAKQRAALVARTLELGLGAVERVDQLDPPVVGPNRRCPNATGDKDSCDGPVSVAVALTIQIVGSETSATVLHSAGALGASSADIEPRDPSSERSIERAVLGARRDATRAAAAAARHNANSEARAIGMRVARVLAVTESQPLGFVLFAPPFYPPVVADAAAGTYGPGRYCGTRQRLVPVPGRNGKPRLVRRTVRACRVPPHYDSRLQIEVELVPRLAAAP